MSISYEILSANFNFVIVNNDIKESTKCIVCHKQLLDVDKNDCVIVKKCGHIAAHKKCLGGGEIYCNNAEHQGNNVSEYVMFEYFGK